jgi:hypothetical protein
MTTCKQGTSSFEPCYGYRRYNDSSVLRPPYPSALAYISHAAAAARQAEGHVQTYGSLSLVICDKGKTLRQLVFVGRFGEQAEVRARGASPTGPILRE